MKGKKREPNLIITVAKKLKKDNKNQFSLNQVLSLKI